MIKTYGARKLGRTPAHRRALVRNLLQSLLLHERVKTSTAKAKELRRLTERVIARAKRGEHLWVRSAVHDKAVFRKLLEVLAPRYQGRASGFTQVLRIGSRRGDRAEMSLIRLVS